MQPEPIRIARLALTHAEQVLDIYRSRIEEGNATFETEPPTWATFDKVKLADIASSPPTKRASASWDGWRLEVCSLPHFRQSVQGVGVAVVGGLPVEHFCKRIETALDGLRIAAQGNGRPTDVGQGGILMERDGTEPQSAPAVERDAAQEIQDSFQAILDALDAARTELYVESGNRRTASPPRSFDHHSEAAANGSRADAAKAPSFPPTLPPPAACPRAQRMGLGPAGLVPAPPQGVPPSVVDPQRTGHVRRAPQDPVVQPLWSRGAPQEAERQPTASDAGPTRSEPSAARPVPGPVRASVRRGAGSPPDFSWTADPGRSAPHTAPLGGPPHQAPPGSDTVRPPVPEGGPGHRRFTNRRHARIAGIFGLGAVSGLILASSLLRQEHSEPMAPPASLEQPERPLPGDPSLPEIPGTGVLREGDSGHGVYELQVRLLQVPQLYDGGAIDGRFGTEVRQAVARFQQRFGIRGDETGVYGDKTRHALMLRTK